MAQPLVQPVWAQGKIVRTKSIPNVDIDRLRDSLAALHWALHTPEGIRAQDIGHGKIHVAFARKALAVRDELARRGDPGIIGCRWCSLVSVPRTEGAVMSDEPLMQAARRLHDSIGCSYGDFDPNYSDWWQEETYEAAKAYVTAWEAQNPAGAPKEPR